MSLGKRHRQWAADLVEKIDKVSRERKLDDDESRLLEWAIGLADGAHRNMRIPFRGNRVLAGMSIKRDMSLYRPVTGGKARESARARSAAR